MSLSELNEKDVTFNEKQVADVVKQCVSKVLDSGTQYNHALVSQWSSTIVESCIEKLTSLKDKKPKAYKYIVMQNNGAGFHTCSSCLWDSCDGMVVEKMEGKFLYCITTVYALSL